MLKSFSAISVHNMKLRDIIYSWFVNSNFEGTTPIKELQDSFPARVFRLGGEYGVMFPIDKSTLVINESFSNVNLRTRFFEVDCDGFPQDYLTLSCKLDGEKFSRKFALLCEDFLEPGENGKYRAGISADPFQWWSEWKKVIGNKEKSAAPYPIIGEMISLDLMLTSNEDPVWEGPDAGTVDIRGRNYDCEVKSTILRESKEITLSSVHQLDGGNKELHLFYCCFQPSSSGVNINDMVKRVVSHGEDVNEIEEFLKSRGFGKGTASRMERYELLYIEEYLVDAKFPRIVLDTFVEGKMPKGVLKLTYVISLSGLDCKVLNYR